MAAEVGRDVADPETALGRAIVGMRLNEASQRLGVLLIPPDAFPINGVGVIGGMEREGEDQITVSLGGVGVQSDRLMECRDRLVELPPVLQSVAEIAAGVRI